MAEHDLVIVGAGISGLSLAYYAAQAGLRSVVLERSDVAGGCLHSVRTGDFWHELGAHTCYNSYVELIALLEAYGLQQKILPRAKVPFMLLIEGEPRSVARELRIGELLCALPRLVSTKRDGRTVQDYYSRFVGPENYRRVLGPMITAAFSQPADAFPAEMMFKSRGVRRRDVCKSFTLEGGLQTLADALAADPKISVRLNAEVREVAREGTRFVVTLSDGERLMAGRLALAVPPAQACELVRAVNPGAATILGRMKVSEIDSIGVIVDKTASSIPPVAGLIPINGPYYSAVSRDTVPDAAHRGFAFHARPGAASEQRLQDAARALRINRDQITHVTRRQATLPAPELGHATLVAELEAAVAKSPLALTGNYFGGLALEDCVLRSKSEVARLLR